MNDIIVQQRSRTGKNNSNWKGGKISKTCLCCGKISTKFRSQFHGIHHFCSGSCRSKYHNKKEKNPNWKGGKTIKTQCAGCGSTILKYPSTIRRTSFCSEKCHSIFMSTENCWSWQGGISFLPYASDFNKRLKHEIKTRDNFTCQGCTKTNMRLTIHHIDHDKKNSSDTNLITTCQSCNSKANGKKNFWIVFYSMRIKFIKNRAAMPLC